MGYLLFLFIEELEFDVLLFSDDYTYEISNNENLVDGSTVIVRVNDDDGERRYKIYIHKDIDIDALFKKFSIIANPSGVNIDSG